MFSPLEGLVNQAFVEYLSTKLSPLISASTGPIHILEVGCGSGALGAILHSKYQEKIKYLGIDASHSVIKQAFARGIHHVEAVSFEDFPITNTTQFDAVLFTKSFHHLPSLSKAAKKTYDLLKPGGLLIADEFAREVVDEATATFFFKRSDEFEDAGEFPTPPRHPVSPDKKLDYLYRWNSKYLAGHSHSHSSSGDAHCHETKGESGDHHHHHDHSTSHHTESVKHHHKGDKEEKHYHHHHEEAHSHSKGAEHKEEPHHGHEEHAHGHHEHKHSSSHDHSHHHKDKEHERAHHHDHSTHQHHDSHQHGHGHEHGHGHSHKDHGSSSKATDSSRHHDHHHKDGHCSHSHKGQEGTEHKDGSGSSTSPKCDAHQHKEGEHTHQQEEHGHHHGNKRYPHTSAEPNSPSHSHHYRLPSSATIFEKLKKRFPDTEMTNTSFFYHFIAQRFEGAPITDVEVNIVREFKTEEEELVANGKIVALGRRFCCKKPTTA